MRPVVIDEDDLSAVANRPQQSVDNPAFVVVRHLVQQKKAAHGVVCESAVVGGVPHARGGVGKGAQLAPAILDLKRGHIENAQTALRSQKRGEIGRKVAVHAGWLEDMLAGPQLFKCHALQAPIVAPENG